LIHDGAAIMDQFIFRMCLSEGDDIWNLEPKRLDRNKILFYIFLLESSFIF